MKNTLKIMILVASCTSMISYSASRDKKGHKPVQPKKTELQKVQDALHLLQNQVKDLKRKVHLDGRGSSNDNRASGNK